MSGFLPVYLRGDGDLKAAVDFDSAALPGLVLLEDASFGVVCTPVTCVGESTTNSSSEPSGCCAPC